jgi:hypothetical protein
MRNIKISFGHLSLTLKLNPKIYGAKKFLKRNVTNVPSTMKYEDHDLHSEQEIVNGFGICT